MTTPELPPLRPSTYGQATTKSEPQPRTYTAKSVEARERILVARVERLELTVQELGLRNADLEAHIKSLEAIREAGVNLARSIKEALKADAAAKGEK